MKTLVIGANGQIGRIFCSKAHKAGLPIRAMVRKESQASSFRGQGIETVVADYTGSYRDRIVTITSPGERPPLVKSL